MIVADGNGIPMGLHLDSANLAEVTLAKQTLDAVRVPRLQGRPKQRPRLLGRVRKLSRLPAMARTELTDAQWERLRPLLPPQKRRTGRPSKNHRTVINGILWVLRTGAPWRDLPERYGSWKTISSRFYRWRSAGVWQQILQKLQQRADGEGKLDWSLHYVDSTVVRAHQHAAGAKGGKEARRWVEVVAGSAPRCMCVPRGRASRSSSCSRVASVMN